MTYCSDNNDICQGSNIYLSFSVYQVIEKSLYYTFRGLYQGEVEGDFHPGFAWTLVFFNRRQINVIERIVLSFGLSIAVVTLSIFSLNILIGVRITGLNSILIIIGITIIPVALYYLNRFIRRH